MKRFNGFTLAEVLITLGIIGVVAAITMPTLIANHQKQVYVTGLKKGINTIQNSINQMKAEEMTDIENTELFTTAYCPGINGNCLNWNGDTEYMVYSDVQRILSKYLKVVKTYKPGEYSAKYRLARYNATPENYILEQSLSDFGRAYGYVAFYTPDGMIFYINSLGWGGMEIIIDVNGEKGPNQQGRDIFELVFYFNNASHTKDTYEYDNFITYLMKNGWKMDY